MPNAVNKYRFLTLANCELVSARKPLTFQLRGRLRPGRGAVSGRVPGGFRGSARRSAALRAGSGGLRRHRRTGVRSRLARAGNEPEFRGSRQAARLRRAFRRSSRPMPRMLRARTESAVMRAKPSGPRARIRPGPRCPGLLTADPRPDACGAWPGTPRRPRAPAPLC